MWHSAISSNLLHRRRHCHHHQHHLELQATVISMHRRSVHVPLRMAPHAMESTPFSGPIQRSCPSCVSVREKPIRSGLQRGAQFQYNICRKKGKGAGGGGTKHTSLKLQAGDHSTVIPTAQYTHWYRKHFTGNTIKVTLKDRERAVHIYYYQNIFLFYISFTYKMSTSRSLPTTKCSNDSHILQITSLPRPSVKVSPYLDQSWGVEGRRGVL